MKARFGEIKFTTKQASIELLDVQQPNLKVQSSTVNLLSEDSVKRKSIVRTSRDGTAYFLFLEQKA